MFRSIAWLPVLAARVGITRQPVLDFHLRDHRNGQLRRCFLTEPRHHGLVAAHKIAQHIGREEVFHEKAFSRGGSNSPRYDSKGGMSETPCHSRISDGQPGLPSVFLSSHSRSALRINPLDPVAARSCPGTFTHAGAGRKPLNGCGERAWRPAVLKAQQSLRVAVR